MKKRIGAFLCALLLLLNLTVPLASASANSSNLPPVGWAETVSSFLMACGIYPFETDEDGNYTEWSVGSLVPLWNQFREDVSTVTSDIRDMAGYLVNGVIAIASGRWSVLREFASWIVNKFNVTDNQTGVELGVYEGGLLKVPGLPNGSNSTWFAGNSAYGVSNSSGDLYYYCPLYTWAYAGKTVSSATGENLYVLVRSDFRFNGFYGLKSYYDSPHNVTPTSTATQYNFTYNGQGYVYYAVTFYASNIVSPAGDVPYYESLDQFGRAVLGLEDVSEFSGVTADTTTVSIPAELPADTPYGGLTVAGAGAAVTVETLTEIVQEAVIEGLKPVVNALLVNLSPDIEVNPDSGEITQGEITITPADIDLVSSDYQIRQLHTVFPFSIPWDVANVFSALNAEPVRPYWEVSLTLPGILGQPDTQIPFTIGISDDNPLSEAVDNFAALIRNFLLVLMCVGTLVLFFKR